MSTQLPIVVEGAPPVASQQLDTPQRIRSETLRQIVRSRTFIVLAILVLTALSAGAEGISVSPIKLIVVIGIAFTPIVARTVRSAVLAERSLDYVQAAKLRGERPPYIMLVEILPNVTGPIIVEATVRLGYAVFAVATL